MTDSPVRRVTLILSTLLACAAPVPALGGPRVLARIDSPVRARLEVQHYNGRMTVNMSWVSGGDVTVLVVERTPLVELGVEGDGGAPQLESDATGARLAYRFLPTSPWHVVYLGKSGVYRACGTLPSAAHPSWQGVAELLSAVPSLVDCSNNFPSLMSELDPGAAAALIAAHADSEVFPAGTWDTAFAALDKPQKKASLARLEKALLEGGSSIALTRALRYVDLARPQIGKALAARAQQLDPATDPGTLDLLLDQLASRAPSPELGALACRAMTTATANDWASIPMGALAVVAATRTRCEPIDVAATKNPCMWQVLCRKPSDHVCSLEEARAEIAAPAGSPSTGDRVGHLLLAALDAQSPKLADSLRRRARRMFYRVEQPATPACSDAAMGAACHGLEVFGTVRAQGLCQLSLEAKSGQDNFCEYQIDDAGGRLFNVRRR